MEGRLQSAQTRFRSANQENEELRSSVARVQQREADMERELQRQSDQIGYSGVQRRADQTIKMGGGDWTGRRAFPCGWMGQNPKYF